MKEKSLKKALEYLEIKIRQGEVESIAITMVNGDSAYLVDQFKFAGIEEVSIINKGQENEYEIKS